MAAALHLSGLVIRLENKSLTLEFLDGRLNGFDASRVDQPAFDKAALSDAAQPDSSSAAVIARLGPPTGQALCPTQLHRGCAEGERWVYRGEDATAIFETCERVLEKLVLSGGGQ